MRLIDADALFKELDEICNDFSKPREAVVYVDCIADIISDAPTVDAAQVMSEIIKTAEKLIAEMNEYLEEENNETD